MCGIYGSLGCGLELESSLAALRAIAHRGPDGEGHHRDERSDVFLGHRRLSIVDLSPGGAQPMTNEDHSVWLVCNGEIYNHLELRKELEAKGHRFVGHCDTEVVVHLYEELGERMLERLVGMFALAIWDERRKALLLARDRIGIKPLHYYFDGRRLAFASELSAIRATRGLDLSPDVTAYWDFLTYQFVPAPKTIFAKAHKLPAGHLAWFANGRLSVRKWWDLEFAPDEAMDEARALDELESLLTTVVRDHLLADVPVGLFLSGGVDSSLVATRVAKLASEPTSAFTIRFPERGDDEAEIAQATAQRLGFEWHVQDFGLEDLLDVAPRMPELFDEPFGDQAALPMFGLSRMTASKIKVVLSGDGGDETQLGYARYFKEGERRVVHALADALPGRALVRNTPLKRASAVRNALGGRGAACRTSTEAFLPKRSAPSPSSPRRSSPTTTTTGSTSSTIARALAARAPAVPRLQDLAARGHPHQGRPHLDALRARSAAAAARPPLRRILGTHPRSLEGQGRCAQAPAQACARARAPARDRAPPQEGLLGPDQALRPRARPDVARARSRRARRVSASTPRPRATCSRPRRTITRTGSCTSSRPSFRGPRSRSRSRRRVARERELESRMTCRSHVSTRAATVTTRARVGRELPWQAARGPQACGRPRSLFARTRVAQPLRTFTSAFATLPRSSRERAVVHEFQARRLVHEVVFALDVCAAGGAEVLPAFGLGTDPQHLLGHCVDVALGKR
jgi:asparagine synthase (glutamine-hydrolysing)